MIIFVVFHTGSLERPLYSRVPYRSDSQESMDRSSISTTPPAHSRSWAARLASRSCTNARIATFDFVASNDLSQGVSTAEQWRVEGEAGKRGGSSQQIPYPQAVQDGPEGGSPE